MKTLTFFIVLVMEISYAMWLISSYYHEWWLWRTFLPVAAVYGISSLLVWIYCRLRKVNDIKSVMKSGITLICGVEVGAAMLYSIAEAFWR